MSDEAFCGVTTAAEHTGAEARVDMQTLIVRRAESAVLLEADASALTQLVPHAKTVLVPDASHAVQGANPAQFTHELRTFLHAMSYFSR